VRKDRQKERKKEGRKKDRQKSLQSWLQIYRRLRKFRLSYRNWRSSIAGKFLVHRIRKFNAGKFSNTNFKYMKV
jgi:hypothetical protein